MFRTLAATAALALSLPFAFAAPSEAATSRHCHTRADWSLVDQSRNSTVRVKLWRAPDSLDSTGRTVMTFCAEAFDRHNSPRAVRLGVSQFEDGPWQASAHRRGGNRVSLKWTTTRQPEPLLVAANVRGHRTVYAAFLDAA